MELYFAIARLKKENKYIVEWQIKLLLSWKGDVGRNQLIVLMSAVMFRRKSSIPNVLACMPDNSSLFNICIPVSTCMYAF